MKIPASEKIKPACFCHCDELNASKSDSGSDLECQHVKEFDRPAPQVQTNERVNEVC